MLPLGDFKKTTAQGISSSIFALIALDSEGYEIPRNEKAKTQAARQLCIDEILARELPQGGFSLSGNEPDPDITAIAIQAFSKYKDYESVSKSADRGLLCFSEIQKNDGGFESWGVNSSESAAQVIIALNELNIPMNGGKG